MTEYSAYAQLKPVERVFVDAHVSDMATGAHKAGKAVKEFMKTAHPKNHALLKKPLVLAAIGERIAEFTKAVEISAHAILAETDNIARANIADYVDFELLGPEFKLSSATNRQLAAVQSIRIKRDSQGMINDVEIKLHSKLDAIDKLMRYMGLYEADKDKLPGTVAPGAAPQQQIAAHTTTAQAADLYARTLKG